MVSKRCETPHKPGYYWAKWKVHDEGTTDGHLLTPSDKWEVVEVYLDAENLENLKVDIPGIAQPQSVENFFWGPGPLKEPE